MANCVLAWPDYSVPQPTPSTTGNNPSLTTPTYSGGSWAATHPITNLGEPKLYKASRSANALATSTTFEIDFQVARACNVFALVRHNLSQAATIRIRMGTVAGFASGVVYDSGNLPVYYPYYVPGTMPFGWSPAVWTGGPTAEELLQYKSLAWSHVHSAIITTRYLRVDIVDTANAAGYVQFSRFFCGPGYQPLINMSYGAQLGWISETQSERSLGGVNFFDVRPSRRRATFTLEGISPDRALQLPFELQRYAGKDKELFFVFDPDDTYHKHRRSFLATLEELPPLSLPYYNAMTAPFQLLEVL